MTGGPLFQVSNEVFELFPDYIVGCVAARGLAPGDGHRIDEILNVAEVRAHARYSGIDLKSESPFAVWREAFSAAGWSPSRFPASVEALHKRVQRGGDAPRINRAVDLANATVLYYSVPVGTHDLSTFDGQLLEVRKVRAADEFIDMNGQAESAVDGEIVYTVGNDIRTRRWVWRQGKNGLVAPDANDIFFPIDGFADRTHDQVDAAVNFLAETCKIELGAQVSTGIVTKDAPTFTL